MFFHEKEKIKKIVLAFSGGLDTSVILKWLQEKFSCEVATFTADIGQIGEVSKAKEVANDLGVKQIFIEDLKEEFVKDYVFPMLRANAVYEGTYLLGTAIARPLIAKKQIEIAKKLEQTVFRMVQQAKEMTKLDLNWVIIHKTQTL